MCVCIPHLLLSIHGHLDCFYDLAIVNSAARNKEMHESFLNYTFSWIYVKSHLIPCESVHAKKHKNFTYAIIPVLYISHIKKKTGKTTQDFFKVVFSLFLYFPHYTYIAFIVNIGTVTMLDKIGIALCKYRFPTGKKIHVIGTLVLCQETCCV